jgi:imidazolonepropionase-like amidohydrolase
MRPKALLGVLLAMASALAISPAATAQVPKDQLAKPPADAKHWVIMSTGGKHGDSYAWSATDGTAMGRESLLLRGQVWEIDSTRRIDPLALRPVSIVVRGVTPSGDAGETFSMSHGTAEWKSPVDSGTAETSSKYYNTFGGPIELTAAALETLLKSPDRKMNLLPGGAVSAEKLTDLVVGQGAAQRTITAWALTGLGTSPTPLWSNADGSFFGANFGGFAWLPAGYESALQPTLDAQNKALAVKVTALSRMLPVTPKGPVAFTGVRLFDADAKRFLTGQTVVVSAGRIAAIGPAASVKIPAGAQRIDGTGKTLVPGLWDVHMHVGDDYTGFQELSLGVTSVRDPGNNDMATMARAKRRAAGDLLFPNVYASSLIDGKGPNTAQVANVATSEAEAIALVRRAKANGFIGVKFYGTFDPKWLPAAIAEAHKLGLHVHGHIPQGIRPDVAVKNGYDEITHINWIMMQGMPDSVIATSNGIARFEGPGRYAKDIDLSGPVMAPWIKTLADRKIYSDPTMVAFEGIYVPENGDLSPSYAPFVGTLPPSTERSFRQGGFKVPNDLTRADFRASWAKMVALVGAMHKAGVPIASGTDGFGIELVHELEIYVQAGMTNAEALAAATIVPARLVGQDTKTGSIAVGKIADLVLVEGDPSIRIGDLRQTRTVMLGGKLLDADALRAAAGFSGRPK